MKVTQSCPTLCDPMGYRVHGILQARILEWIAFPFSRGYSQPKDQTQVSYTAGRVFTICTSREAYQRKVRILIIVTLKGGGQVALVLTCVTTSGLEISFTENPGPWMPASLSTLYLCGFKDDHQCLREGSFPEERKEQKP